MSSKKNTCSAAVDTSSVVAVENDREIGETGSSSGSGKYITRGLVAKRARELFEAKAVQEAPTKRLAPGHKDYGTAPEGSLSAARVEHAKDWLDEEIEKLLRTIVSYGTVDQLTRKVYIKFKDLFDAYVDISNTVVGLLMRARKRGHVSYSGNGMLYQRQSDDVLITIDAPSHMLNEIASSDDAKMLA